MKDKLQLLQNSLDMLQETLDATHIDYEQLDCDAQYIEHRATDLVNEIHDAIADKRAEYEMRIEALKAETQAGLNKLQEYTVGEETGAMLDDVHELFKTISELDYARKDVDRIPE